MNFIKAESYSKKSIDRYEILLFIILMLMVLPFFILAFFNHPSADDYCIASMIKNNSFWDYQKAMYNSWTGRYFANFIEALYTKNLDLVIASRLIPITLLFLLFTSIYNFLHTFLNGEISKFKTVIFPLVFFILYLNLFPSTGEGIYWITGATEYLFANILTLFFLTSIIKLNKTENIKKRILIMLTAVVLAFMTIGLNEINLCIVFSISFISILYRLYFRQKFNYLNLIIFICVLVFCYVDISAPGNYLRAGEFSSKFSFFASLKISAISCIKLFGIHFQNPTFLLISVIFIPSAVYISKRIEIFNNIIKINPFIILFLSIAFIFLLYIPATFSMGINPPLRVHSTIALVFLMLWFFNIIVFINFLNPEKQESITINRKVVSILWVIIIISMLTDFYKEPGQQINFRGNIFRALYDLTFRADDYNKQMNSRYQQINEAVNSGKKTVEFQELKNIPTTIFFVDVSIEKNHWINSCYSQYFSIDTIELKNR